MIGASMAVRPSRSRGPVLMMIDALRRLGGTLIYAPDNLAGTYVDNVGTTPVTAVADLIGLITDKSYGGQLGVELVTNGDFSAGTAGWIATSATISTVGGELSVLAASTAQPSAAQAISTVSGKTYKISARLRADAANAVAKSARVRVAETASGGLIYSGPYEVTSNGVARELTAFFTAPIATAYVLLEVGSSSAYGNVGDRAYFDNISVREVPGNHATQSAVASKPSLQRVNGRNVISFDGSNDFLQTGITTGNEGFVAAGVTFGGAASAIETISYSGGTAHTVKGVWLTRVGSSSENELWCGVSDGTYRDLAIVSSVPLRNNQRVVSGGWATASVIAGVDSTEVTVARTNSTAAPGVAPIAIGSVSGAAPFSGPMHAFAYTPVLPSAADRKTIRNGIAALQGRTL